jgi:hypothetical protein
MLRQQRMTVRRFERWANPNCIFQLHRISDGVPQLWIPAVKLFPDTLMAELAAEDGDDRCLLKQMLNGPQRAVLSKISELYERSASPVQQRWEESLRSTDNRKFFQGYAEAISAAFLGDAGWSLVDVCSPRPCLVMRHEDGREQRLITLAFMQTPQRPEEQAALEQLARIANRADSDRRITILVHKWTPHDFNPEPVRRCIDIWLDAIAKGTWNGRYATFEDDHIHLEFTRTDEPTRPGQGSVAFLLAPNNGFDTMDLVESRMVYELDNLLKKSKGDRTLLVSLVTNTSWMISPGLIRSLLYGRPVWQVTNGSAQNRKFGFQVGDGGPALFQEDGYQRVAGTLVIDQHADRGPCGRAYLNPWATKRMNSTDVVCASFSEERSEGDFRVMSWR